MVEEKVVGAKYVLILVATTSAERCLQQQNKLICLKQRLQKMLLKKPLNLQRKP